MKKHLINLVALASFLLFSVNLNALEVGDQAPAFEALDDHGKSWKSESFRGKKLLLVYFYPAAMTGGCTKQACAFRDDKAKWSERNVEVIGVSGDQSKNLALFKQAEGLNFTLLADSDGKVAKAFGVPAGKGGSIDRFVKGEKFTLNRGVTTKRWTFLVSKDGQVLYKNDKVQAAQDSSVVLDFLKKKNNP
jgi:peroxiredoxin Q/BCP